ncbi:ATP-grasp domain-containing protein [Marinicrinis lubricantis]
MNILITSISKKVPLIRAVREAAAKIKGDHQIIGADSNRECVGKYFVDDFWEMPLLSELSEQELIRFCAQKQVDVIIPTRDGELLYFAGIKERLRREGIYVMISSFSSIQKCLDKLEFYTFGRDRSYPVIPTSLNVSTLPYDRYAVKERFGAGSSNIGLNLTVEEAQDWAKRMRHPIFQPYIEGSEASIDLYVGMNGKVKGCICRYRELTVGGESQITTVFEDEKLQSESVRMVESLGLYGHVVVQVMMDRDGAFHFIECNSRFGGASTASIRAGLDSFYWALLESQGIHLGSYSFERKNGIKMVRYAEDLFIEQ